jgi:ribosomal protein S18 acetylase RimI-like enzyme
MFTIRRIVNANPAVAGAIYSVRQQAYTQEAELIGAQDFPPLAVTTQDLMRSHNQFLGAFQETRLLGVLSIEVSPTLQRSMISSLVVVPSAQRQGVGRALIREALALTGSYPLWVQTALLNEAAIALYQDAGFTVQEHVLLASGLELVQLAHLRGSGAIAV